MNKYYIKLCLCIFGGPLGLHYWYTKKYGKAIIFLLTSGGCGIWYIFDIIRLIFDKKYLSDDVVDNKNAKCNNSIIIKEINMKKYANEEDEYASVKSKVDNTNNKVLKNNIEQLENKDIVAKEDLKGEVKELDDILNNRFLQSTELYLKAFNDLPKYDMNKELDDTFLKKIKRVKEVEYEKFVKPSGTTNRPMNFVVFDLETTGLNPVTNEIIEIGAVRFDTNKPVEVFHTFIKPKKNISAKITSINGITNEMVESCPTIEEVIPRFIDFIGDDVLVAHNSDFDMGFILNQLYSQGYKKIKNKAIDTLKLSRQKVREYDILTDRNKKLDSYKLENLKYAFSLWNVGSHNAIDDCKVCAYVYLKVKNEYGDFCYVD